VKGPRVTVALPVHDGGPYLAAALRSVLRQSLDDFEVVVVDNASTDDTAATLARFDDPRLRVVRSLALLPMADSHNLAAASGSAPLIAFMGADDVAAPERLATQVAAFEADPALGLASSWARLIDERGDVRGELRYPTSDEQLRRVSLRYHAFILPALVIRRSLFEELGGFDRRYDGAMDYDLTLRALERARGANLPLPLVDVRFHTAQGSLRRFRELRRGDVRARLAALRRGGRPRREALWILQPLLASLLPVWFARRVVVPYMLAFHGRRAR
jgi:glycosyltransferase involved in cell wall biosynthesis